MHRAFYKNVHECLTASHQAPILILTSGHRSDFHRGLKIFIWCTWSGYKTENNTNSFLYWFIDPVDCLLVQRAINDQSRRDSYGPKVLKWSFLRSASRRRICGSIITSSIHKNWRKKRVNKSTEQLGVVQNMGLSKRKKRRTSHGAADRCWQSHRAFLKQSEIIFTCACHVLQDQYVVALALKQDASEQFR